MRYLNTIIISLGLVAAISADTIKATVNGMVCGFCATGIEKTFKAQPEVSGVQVDLAHKLVTIETKTGQTMTDVKLTQLMKNSGYSVVKVERAK